MDFQEIEVLSIRFLSCDIDHMSYLKLRRNWLLTNLWTKDAIEKNNNIRTVQAEPSKFASLLLDQGFQIVIPPRIVANVPEPIRTPSDDILHWSNCCLFRHLYIAKVALKSRNSLIASANLSLSILWGSDWINPDRENLFENHRHRA